MKELQALVAKAVADRGYRQGWTDEQYAARQICKAVEELGELILAVIWQHGHNNPEWYLSLMDAKENAREAFDSFDAGFWSYVDDIDTDEIVAELPDVLIPLFVLAETLDIDLEQAVREKVLGDVSRGVRGKKPEEEEQQSEQMTAARLEEIGQYAALLFEQGDLAAVVVDELLAEIERLQGAQSKTQEQWTPFPKNE